MFCRKCGYQLPDDSNFCSKCGASLVQNARENSTVYYLKIYWWCTPLVRASTNLEKLAQMIYQSWKSKASLPQFVKYSNENGEFSVSYEGVKFTEFCRMQRYSREVELLYEELKNYAIINAWVLAEPEVHHYGDSHNTIGLDCIFTK